MCSWIVQFQVVLELHGRKQYIPNYPNLPYVVKCEVVVMAGYKGGGKSAWFLVSAYMQYQESFYIV